MSNTTLGIVTRGYVRNGFVLVDVTLLNGETRTRVELRQPHGITAVPHPGARVVVDQLGPGRGHLIAHSADDPALRFTEAGPGDWAVTDHRGQSATFTADGIRITGTPKVFVEASGEVVVTAPAIRLGSAGANKRVVLDGDPCDGSSVTGTATRVFGE